CEDMRSLILIVAFLHQEDITTNNYLNLSILKQLQEAFGMIQEINFVHSLFFFTKSLRNACLNS
ncbi:MAG: hypothetical protein QXL15_04995, partial [Candidatus Korarchaeota archaeon]